MVALQSKRSSLNLPCGSEAKMTSSQSLFCINSQVNHFAFLRLMLSSEMKLIKLCFFALLTTIAPRVAVINGNSGADPWDSDFTLSLTPFLLECRIPTNSSHGSINVNLTQEEREQVEIEGRCFLACATHYKYINEVKNHQ